MGSRSAVPESETAALWMYRDPPSSTLSAPRHFAPYRATAAQNDLLILLNGFMDETCKHRIRNKTLIIYLPDAARGHTKYKPRAHSLTQTVMKTVKQGAD